MRPFVVNRWVSLTAGILSMFVAGTIYLFSAYSSNLKSALNLNNQDTNLIATMGNAGTWVSIVGGLFYDRFGTLPTLYIGATLLFLGYFGQYLTVRYTPGDGSMQPIMCIAAFVMGQGGGWIYTVALNTNAANFRHADHGKILGLLTCSFALCSGIFTLIYNGFFNGSEVEDFLLFLSIALPATALLLSTALNVLPQHYMQYDSLVVGQHALRGYFLLFLLALYICVASFVQTFTNVSPFDLTLGMLGVILLMLSLPLSSGRLIWKVSGEFVPLLNDSLEGESPVAKDEFSVSIGEYNLWDCVRSVNYWLLFFITACGIGTGITVVNNLSDILVSRDALNSPSYGAMSDIPNHKEVDALVALFSIFNALGRLGAGYFSDALHSHKYTRAWILVFGSVVMCAAQLGVAWASLDILYLIIILVGVAEGAFFSTIPTICLELFSIKHFGANWSFLTVGSAGLSVLLGSFVAGLLSDRVGDTATHSRTIDGTEYCFGNSCYFSTFLITAGVCVLGLAASIVLTRRLQPLYASHGSGSTLN
eukprot:m.412138 g.412138  ORF g.412138 m.412138 type:complete len:536 (-) comp56564_c0_seq2:231-1838(-)